MCPYSTRSSRLSLVTPGLSELTVYTQGMKLGGKVGEKIEKTQTQRRYFVPLDFSPVKMAPNADNRIISSASFRLEREMS